MINQLVKLLRKDILIKVILFLVAVSLWSYVASSQSKIGNFPGALKIDKKNIPAGMIANLSTGYADLEISADRNRWSQLQPDSFDVYVDLDELQPGTHELPVQATSKLADVKILSVQPETILVNLENTLSREMPVTVEIKGSPAENYTLGSYRANPDTVIISAAQSLLKNDIRVVANVDVAGANQTFDKKIKLEVVDEQEKIQNNITINPAEVTVRVNVAAVIQTKTVGIRPNVTGTPASGFFVASVSVSPATIQLSGNTDALSSVSFLQTSNVDVTDLAEDRSFPAQIDFPSGTSANTREVQIKVTLGKSN